MNSNAEASILPYHSGIIKADMISPALNHLYFQGEYHVHETHPFCLFYSGPISFFN